MQTNARALRNAYLGLHLCVILAGFTAILGKLISLSGPVLVWYRVIITAVTLMVVPGLVMRVFSLPLKAWLEIFGIGALVAAHWVCFYTSLKVGNISVTLACIGASALITSLCEPVINGKSVNWRELALGALVLPGLWLIYHTGDTFHLGLLIGLASAVFGALFSIYNKRVITKYDPMVLGLGEMISCSVLVGAWLPLLEWIYPSPTFVPATEDLLWLLILSVACTAVPFVLGLAAMRHLSAFSVALAYNLEPLYGILLAFWIFQEQKELNGYFYAGVSLILVSVFLQPFISRPKRLSS